MKRLLLKQYDEVNGIYLIHFCRVYADCVHVQTFRTFHHCHQSSRAKSAALYVGNKRRCGSDQWIGKSFLAVLCSAASVQPGRAGYDVRGGLGVQGRLQGVA